MIRKKYIVLLKVLFILIILYFGIFKDMNFDTIKSDKIPPLDIDSLVIRKKLPKDFKNLFKIVNSKVKHFNTSGYKNIEYLNSFINIDSLNINIFKYQISNKEFNLNSYNINFENSQQTNFVWYGNKSRKNTEIYYRHIKNIDTLIILTQKPFDTLYFNQKLLIFKGILKTTSIILQRENLIKTIFLKDDRIFSSLRNGIPYYLIIKRKGDFIYIIFIEALKFNDKKILKLFS